RGSEQPMKANHVEARGRNHGAETGDESVRLEHDGACAVTPGLLQGVVHPAVGEQLEAVLGDGGPGEVTAESLEAFSIAPVDSGGSVHIDSLHDGGGLASLNDVLVDEAEGWRREGCPARSPVMSTPRAAEA